MIAQVIVDIKAHAVDQVFEYQVPVELEVTIGTKVVVPFNHRTVSGYVIGLSETSSYPLHKLKAITSKSDVQFLNEELVALAKYFAHSTASFQTSMLQAMLPKEVADRKVKHTPHIVAVKDGNVAAKATKQVAALIFIKQQSLPYKLSTLRKQFGAAAIKALVEKDILLLTDLEAIEETVVSTKTHPTITLRTEQQEVLRRLHDNVNVTSVLQGVTGSGKTEIYLHYVASLLAQKRQAIVLVPEIGLTPQMIQRFQERFGVDQIAILHSKLSHAARFRMWRKIKQQTVSIVLGTRSAIFAPLENIGVIILDEEHDMSYKQENKPSYHAKDVAIWRAEYHGANVILASATPSLESYIRAQKGMYQLLTLKERQQKGAKDIQIIDMKQYIGEQEHRYFSKELLEGIAGALERQEQSILLLNRRGYAAFGQCHYCGYVPECDHCGVSLTYHKDRDEFCCHYCQHREHLQVACPKCQYPMSFMGVGTQRIAEEIQRIFPQARILRVDRDHVRTQQDYETFYTSFAAQDADILVGTQMIAKGFDFPNVTIVGVLEVDQILHMPDVRAKEKAYQLLIQVIGRMGRGTKPGQAFLQTYDPDNDLFIDVLQENFATFAHNELAHRQTFHNPPYWHISDLIIAAEDLNAVAQCAQYMYEQLQRFQQHATVYPPAKTFLKQINNKYHFHIMLKYKNSHLIVTNVSKLIEHCLNAYPKVFCYLQVNPLSFL